MRFNLSAGVKHVAQLLNPDLEIPNHAAPTSSQPQPLPPPLPSPTSTSSSIPPSEPSTRSRANTLSLRSSLSLRRKRRKAAIIYTPPPTSTPDEYKALQSLQADFAASASQDPTLRFYTPVQPPPAAQPARGSWKRMSAGTSATTRASWNGFQNISGPAIISSTSTTATATAQVPSIRQVDKSTPYFPLAGIARDGYSNDQEATATCFCGAVQLAFPVEGPGLLSTFVCNCADCRKITASMFASNFTVKDEYLKHLRGKANLSKYSQATTIASGHTMTNYFCSTCGSLMYRVGAAFPGCSILRLGTVDDFNLVETKLKPTRELFVKDRVSWFTGVQGHEVKRKQAML